MVRQIAAAGAFVAFATFAGAAAPEGFRNVVKEKGAAVISIEIVMNVKYSARGQQSDSEQKSEVVGTVIDDKGLVVAALSSIDPGAFYSKFSGEEDTYVTRAKKITYLLPDNREIEASVVLRDPDLDLAFLKPTESVEKPFVFIPLDDSADVEILDDVYTMGRMGRIARRELAAMSGEIQAIVTKPRKFYIPHSEIGTAGTGAPVFSGEGKLVGINGMYVFPGGRRALGTSDEPVMFVIRPAVDIVEVAAQARDIEPRSAGNSEPEETEAPEEEPTM